MSWMQCGGCPAKFAVGLLRCPRCGTMSELYVPAGDGGNMPKISTHGGPSNAGDPEQVVEEASDVAVAAQPELDGDDTAEPEPVVEDPKPADDVVADAPAEPEPAKAAPARAPRARKTAAAKP